MTLSFTCVLVRDHSLQILLLSDWLFPGLKTYWLIPINSVCKAWHVPRACHLFSIHIHYIGDLSATRLYSSTWDQMGFPTQRALRQTLGFSLLMLSFPSKSKSTPSFHLFRRKNLRGILDSFFSYIMLDKICYLFLLG